MDLIDWLAVVVCLLFEAGLIVAVYQEIRRVNGRRSSTVLFLLMIVGIAYWLTDTFLI